MRRLNLSTFTLLDEEAFSRSELAVRLLESRK
jgi:hypothetical protein